MLLTVLCGRKLRQTVGGTYAWWSWHRVTGTLPNTRAVTVFAGCEKVDLILLSLVLFVSRSGEKLSLNLSTHKLSLPKSTQITSHVNQQHDGTLESAGGRHSSSSEAVSVFTPTPAHENTTPQVSAAVSAAHRKGGHAARRGLEPNPPHTHTPQESQTRDSSLTSTSVWK